MAKKANVIYSPVFKTDVKIEKTGDGFYTWVWECGEWRPLCSVDTYDDFLEMHLYSPTTMHDYDAYLGSLQPENWVVVDWGKGDK